MHTKGYKEDLATLKEDGMALKFINRQTPELIMTAVKQNGNALNNASPLKTPEHSR